MGHDHDCCYDYKPSNPIAAVLVIIVLLLILFGASSC
jgi:hypothetical protein